MTFELATAGRIIFGEGVLDLAGSLAVELGSRVLAVGGGTPARIEPLLALLADVGLPVSTIAIPSEPSVESALHSRRAISVRTW